MDVIERKVRKCFWTNTGGGRRIKDDDFERRLVRRLMDVSRREVIDRMKIRDIAKGIGSS